MIKYLRSAEDLGKHWFNPFPCLKKHYIYTKDAVKDIQKLKSAGISGKAKSLIDIIRNNPFAAPPRYEDLVGNLSGLFSRRINIQHKLVYQVYDEPFEEEGVEYQGIIKIVRMWKHYDGI